MPECGYVLLVEDNPDEVLLTRWAFQKGEVVNPLQVVTDGRQALDFLFSQNEYAARNRGDRPALILLDLKLPLIGGLDVLKEVKAHPDTAGIPIVILTSSTEERDRSDCQRFFADDYICKPTRLIDFVEIVKALRQRWLI